MRTFESTLVKNSLVRVKQYTRDSFPDHWDSDMLEFCGEIHTIKNVYPREEYDSRPNRINRMDTLRIKANDNWWFYRDDFQKVNTQPEE